ncbi:MAG: OmpA family protein [Spirochaetaceae bacterium]|nr:OmpA family protein [Spirochaetaceae bacterium]
MFLHDGPQENEFGFSLAKEDLRNASKGTLPSKTMTFGNTKKLIILILALFVLINSGLYARDVFPNTDFWSLDFGIGVSDILVEGSSFQVIFDPKLSLTHALMIGARFGANYSIEEDNRNILTFESQAYLRWNFLRIGRPHNTTNVFIQGGIGLLAAYRGNHENTSPFGDVTMTRGSILLDAVLGVTIPLSERWHIEPQIRGGYPHIAGVLLTAGYKFRLPRTVCRELDPSEIVRIIKIAAIEFILFGPDIGRYNVGIDRDAQQLNELVLNYVAQTLNDNPDYRVRIEGHANPYTINVSEAEDLMALSSMRSDTIAEQLRIRGVRDEQMVIVAFGGTRNATSEWDVRNRNRRVELMIIQVDTNL